VTGRPGQGTRARRKGAPAGTPAGLTDFAAGAHDLPRRPSPRPSGAPAEVIRAAVTATNLAHRFMSATDEACRACRSQMRAARDARPHGRLMVVAATPVVEAYGGGVETRYLCLDCGHTVMHSTGRFGEGWH
jgi:hypothetical protein